MISLIGGNSEELTIRASIQAHSPDKPDIKENLYTTLPCFCIFPKVTKYLRSEFDLILKGGRGLVVEDEMDFIVSGGQPDEADDFTPEELEIYCRDILLVSHTHAFYQ